MGSPGIRPGETTPRGWVSEPEILLKEKPNPVKYVVRKPLRLGFQNELVAGNKLLVSNTSKR